MVPAPSTPTVSISGIGRSFCSLLPALRSLFQEGGHPLAFLGGGGEKRIDKSLDADRVAATRCRVETRLRHLHRERRVAGDIPAQLFRRLHRLARLAEPLENAERVGLLGLQNSPC